MTSLIITTREGGERMIVARDGGSVMEAIRGAGMDELLALCGGCLCCATCHVYVDVDWLAGLPVMTEDEDDLLESSDARTKRSRLSCQIPMSPAIAGMRVTVAPET